MALNTTHLYGTGIGTLSDIESSSKNFDKNIKNLLKLKYASNEMVSVSQFLNAQKISKSIIEGGESSLNNGKSNTTPKENRVENAGTEEIHTFVTTETDPLEVGDSDQVDSIKKEIMQEASNQMIQNFYDIYMSPEGECTDIVYRLGKAKESLIYDKNYAKKIADTTPLLKVITGYDKFSMFTPYNFTTSFSNDYYTSGKFEYAKSEPTGGEYYIRKQVEKPSPPAVEPTTKSTATNTSTETYNSTSGSSSSSNTSTETYNSTNNSSSSSSSSSSSETYNSNKKSLKSSAKSSSESYVSSSEAYTPSFKVYDNIKNFYSPSKTAKASETFINFQFPPYKIMQNLTDTYSNLSKNFAKYRSDHFDMKNGIVFNRDFPYREIAFKQINDNIIYIQWLMERVCGIVSTYLTEWDLSLYIQEGLVTNAQGLSPKYISLMHRIQEDAPTDKRDAIQTYPFGVLNAAMSKLMKSNEVSWIPNYYPYSKYWVAYPSHYHNKKYRSKTSVRSRVVFPSFYEVGYKENATNRVLSGESYVSDVLLNGFDSNERTSLRKQLQFDDWQGAALSGYEDWNMNYYKAIYSTKGDDLSDVDVSQMSYSDKYVKNSQLINENLKSIFGTQYGVDDLDNNYVSQDYSTSTAINEDYGEEDEFGSAASNYDTEGEADENYFSSDMSFMESSDNSDDEKSELERKYENKDATADKAMEIATGGNSGTFSASNLSKAADGIMGSSDDVYDNAKTVGIPQRNPVLFGGPHSPYSSPLSIQSYFEMDNPFLRDIPRINPLNIANATDRKRYLHDYELTNDYVFKNSSNKDDYSFSYLEKFSTTQYSFAEAGGNVYQPRCFEHSFTESLNLVKYGIKTAKTNICTADGLDDIANENFVIGQAQIYEQDPTDEGFDIRRDIIRILSEWRHNFARVWFFSGYWGIIRTLIRLFNSPPRYKFESKTVYRLFFPGSDYTGKMTTSSYDRYCGHTEKEIQLKNYLQKYCKGSTNLIFFSHSYINKITSMSIVPVSVKTYPLLSNEDDNGRRAKVGTDWYIEADLSNCEGYYGGLDKSPFNPESKNNSIFDYRINGNNEKLKQAHSASVYSPVEDLNPLNLNFIVNTYGKTLMYGNGVAKLPIANCIFGTGLFTELKLKEGEESTPLLNATFLYKGDEYWRTYNQEQNLAIKKALLYPTFYSSTQAPSYLKQVGTNEKFAHYFKYDPIVSMIVFLNIILKQKTFLKEFSDYFITNKDFSFESLGYMLKNVNHGNPVISKKVYNLSDPKETTTADPADSSKKIDKNKIFGYNRWIAYARDIFENIPKLAVFKVNLGVEIGQKIAVLDTAISTIKPIIDKASIMGLSLNDIKSFQVSMQTVHDSFFKNKKDKKGNYTFPQSNVEKFFLMYLNMLYEIRKYFINKRCNKQDGTLFMMRALESAFPMITSGANADTQVPDFENCGQSDFSNAKTNVAFYTVQNTNRDKVEAIKNKNIDNIPVTIDEDRIDYVYVPVEYTTVYEYEASEQNIKDWDFALPKDRVGERPQKKVIKAVVDGETRYIKKPADGRYRLESLELLTLENNVAFDATLDKNSTDYLLKFKTITSIDRAVWNNLIWGDKNYTFSDTPNVVEADVSIVFNIMVDLNPAKLLEAVSVGIKEPQELLCAAKTPTDFWKIRVVDNLPRSSGYLNNVRLSPYDGYSEGANGLTAAVLGGMNSFNLSPIVKEQANMLPMLQKAIKEAQNMSNQVFEFGAIKEDTTLNDFLN